MLEEFVAGLLFYCVVTPAGLGLRIARRVARGLATSSSTYWRTTRRGVSAKQMITRKA
jgi:hypothetical protein